MDPATMAAAGTALAGLFGGLLKQQTDEEELAEKKRQFAETARLNEIAQGRQAVQSGYQAELQAERGRGQGEQAALSRLSDLLKGIIV